MWKGFSRLGKKNFNKNSNSYVILKKEPSWSSYKERRENDLASGAEEGRDKLRKAAVRSKYP